MASIITISSSKGGCGKTTLSLLIALTLVEQGRSVSLVDADPNGTLSDWHACNYEGPPISCVAEMDHTAIVAKIYAEAEVSQTVIVDTAGFTNITATTAMAAADAILVPCMADRGSVREAMRTVQHAAGLAKASRREIPQRVVLSHWSARGLAEQAAMADLEGSGLACLDAQVPALAALKQITFTGVFPAGRIREVGQAIVTELTQLTFIEPQNRRTRK